MSLRVLTAGVAFHGLNRVIARMRQLHGGRLAAQDAVSNDIAASMNLVIRMALFSKFGRCVSSVWFKIPLIRVKQGGLFTLCGLC